MLEKSMAHLTPAISVIIPCYNLGLYLDDAIESVLAQTMQDFEVIVIDDGSTDEVTCTLLNDFSRPKTRIVRQKNKGLAIARNQGIQQSKALYICCLDADDRLQAEFLEKGFKVLEEQPDVGFVTGYFQMFGERDDVFQYPTCAVPEMLVYNEAIEPALFRRDAWEQAGGYCETFSSSGIEDWDLWITFLELGYRAHVIPEIVWEYRIRSDQMSTNMYHPDNWGQLVRELILRHRETYHDHMLDVLTIQAARWAEIREWANDRAQAVVWWEKQAKNWQRLAEENLRMSEEQQAWIGQLEKDKTSLEEQRAQWQRLAEERGCLISDPEGELNRLRGKK
jgi:glycosyltransferase involved in cell wall biosynthesis